MNLMNQTSNPYYTPLRPMGERMGSLFLATYNMPRHLELVCAALLRQTTQKFEVIVCDDGSGDETRRVVQNFSKQAPFRVVHVWQENQGFRKCKILNEGIRRSQGDVLVFLDGDTIPHRH